MYSSSDELDDAAASKIARRSDPIFHRMRKGRHNQVAEVAESMAATGVGTLMRRTQFRPSCFA